MAGTPSADPDKIPLAAALSASMEALTAAMSVSATPPVLARCLTADHALDLGRATRSSRQLRGQWELTAKDKLARRAGDFGLAVPFWAAFRADDFDWP